MKYLLLVCVGLSVSSAAFAGPASREVRNPDSQYNRQDNPSTPYRERVAATDFDANGASDIRRAAFFLEDAQRLAAQGKLKKACDRATVAASLMRGRLSEDKYNQVRDDICAQAQVA